VRLPAKWASKKKKLIPVMAIRIFLPTDERKVWITQFIFTQPKVPIDADKQRVIPIINGAVQALLA